MRSHITLRFTYSANIWSARDNRNESSTRVWITILPYWDIGSIHTSEGGSRWGVKNPHRSILSRDWGGCQNDRIFVTFTWTMSSNHPFQLLTPLPTPPNGMYDQVPQLVCIPQLSRVVTQYCLTSIGGANPQLFLCVISEMATNINYNCKHSGMWYWTKVS